MTRYKIVRRYDDDIIKQHWGADDSFDSLDDGLHRIREFIAHSSHCDVSEIPKVNYNRIENGNYIVDITSRQSYHIVPMDSE